MPETVSISDFKARCLAILDRVKKTGRPVIVTRRNEPIAQVVPPPPVEGRVPWLGSERAAGQIVGDIVSPAVSPKEWEVLQ
jgi:prevent-host-death family protein